MTALPPTLDPPVRLLCGPGPSNPSPDVLAAMQRPMLGHLDPDMHEIMTEVVELLRGTYRACGGLVIPLQATGSSGMEAGLANLLEPGDTAIVGVNGFFGARIVDIARRHGAEVIEVHRAVRQPRPERATAGGARRPSRREAARGRARRDVDRRRAPAARARRAAA